MTTELHALNTTAKDHTFVLTCPELDGNERILYDFLEDLALNAPSVNANIWHEDDTLTFVATMPQSSEDVRIPFQNRVANKTRLLAGGTFRNY